MDQRKIVAIAFRLKKKMTIQFEKKNSRMYTYVP